MVVTRRDTNCLQKLSQHSARLQSSITRLGQNWLIVTNTLAYYDMKLTTALRMMPQKSLQNVLFQV